MKNFIFILLILFITTQEGCIYWSNQSRLYQYNENLNVLKNKIIKLHNEIRTSKDLQLLAKNTALETTAQKHAELMASRDRLSHSGRGFNKPSDRVIDQGYKFKSIAENIAFGHNSAEEIMNSWMDSDGHRMNILGDYEDIGVGIAYNKNNRVYICVLFGRKIND